jgi:hypothetical protein
MITKTGKIGTTNHVFTAENEFLFQEDWVLQTKGKEFYDRWKLLENADIESCVVYDEWLAENGITHTMTEDE